ncbi:DUF1015 domain-containing protein [Clostridium sp. DL1XJH146]
MAIIKSFKGVRPKKELAEKVAALPYDVMNSDEAREVVKNNPYSFLHVDKAEIDLDENVNSYDEKVYLKAKENLNNMINKNILKEDTESSLYVYRLVMNGRKQTGLVCCSSVDDYLNNIVKKHEHTREVKENDRIKHVKYCEAQTGPIFLTYRNKANITSIIEEWTVNNAPDVNFKAEDGIEHIAWEINDEKIISSIVSMFNEVDSLYIADGHHRCASAAKVALMRREELKGYTGEEEFNYFLSVIFPDDELYIMDYNRVVSDLNGLSKIEFLSRIEGKFDIQKNSEMYKPSNKGCFGMYLEGEWYKLKAKNGSYDSNDEVASLDVSILQENLLHPILGIEDPRKDDRIDFVGGIRGLEELVKRVEGGMKVAFSMYPTSIKELMDIADKNDVMPPKSTWFEPKLRSGLFIHNI